MAPRSLILPLGLAALGLAIAGCVDPGLVGRANGSPAAETSAGHASAAPTATPAGPAEPSVATGPSAGPAESLDSDLEQDDNVAVSNLLDSKELQAYLPSDLIHDGGVILYQTLAVGDRMTTADKTSADRPARPRSCDGADAAPETWKRLDFEPGPHELRLRRVPGHPDQAIAVVKSTNRGVLVYKDPDSGKTVRKPYAEIFRRGFSFVRDQARWKLAELSPILLESQGGHSGLELANVKLFHGDATTPTLQIDEAEPAAALREADTAFTPGETVRVEIEVANRGPCEPFVFLHLVGGNDRSRQALNDDGVEGDRVAGDGIFSGSFFAPATPGTRHFAIDVLAPAAFTAGGLYRSNAIGMNFQVKAR